MMDPPPPSNEGLVFHRSELDRTWDWAFHEDIMFVDRLSYFFLAEAILFGAAVALLDSAQHHRLLAILSLLVDLVGVLVTTAFWYLFAEQNRLIRLLQEELWRRDPRLYRPVRGTLLGRRAETPSSQGFVKEWVRSGAERGVRHGPNWVAAHIVPVVVLGLWLAMMAGSALSI